MTPRLWAGSLLSPLLRRSNVHVHFQFLRHQSYTPWTKEEQEKALALKSQGHHEAFIAGILGRTRQSVSQKLYKIRNKFNEPRGHPRAWSRTECERLAELWNQGTHLAQIVRSLDRSRRSVQDRVGKFKRGATFETQAGRPRRSVDMKSLKDFLSTQRFRGAYPRSLHPLSEWKLSDDETLRRLRENTMPRPTWAQIAEQMGRTSVAVSSRYHKIARDQPKGRWSKEDARTAIEMAAAGISTLDISIVLGRTRATICARLRKGGPDNEPRFWTKAEQECLMSMRSTGTAWTEIAVKLDRSVDSVKSQYYHILKIGRGARIAMPPGR